MIMFVIAVIVLGLAWSAGYHFGYRLALHDYPPNGRRF
jgi:type IV secretory pathway VirB2 component (pilin)